MSTFLKTYDPDEVTVWVSTHEVSGFAEGDMVTVERNEDIFNPVVGSKGEVSRAFNRNMTGTATIRLQHTSPSIRFLDALIAAEEQNGVPPVISVAIKDPASGEDYLGTQGWIITQPTRTWSNEVGVREYQFFLVNVISATEQTSTENTTVFSV